MMCSQCILVMLIQVGLVFLQIWPHMFWFGKVRLFISTLMTTERTRAICVCVKVVSPQLGVETKSWTIVHWGAIVLSVGLYLGFGLIYNAVCYQCQGLTNPYLVMQVWPCSADITLEYADVDFGQVEDRSSCGIFAARAGGTFTVGGSSPHRGCVCTSKVGFEVVIIITVIINGLLLTVTAIITMILTRVFCRAVANSLHPTEVARAVIERKAWRRGKYTRSTYSSFSYSCSCSCFA